MSLSRHLSIVVSVAIVVLASVCDAGCPFAAMTQSYNFSGDWSFNVTSDGSDAYLMHLCHLDNHEIFFTVARNHTPDQLIGFGAGNWSQATMMMGGQLFTINNGTSSSHGFGIGMNMELHQWWYQDQYRSSAVDEGAKATTLDARRCGIFYGVYERREYWKRFWDEKRKFNRNKRVKKRRIDHQRKKKAAKDRKKAFYVRYYEQLVEWLGRRSALLRAMSEDETETISDDELNAVFVWNEQPTFPTLYGSSWVSEEHGMQLTVVDEANACFNGQKLSNMSVALDGIAINSYTEQNNGIRNGQFFVQIDQNKVLGSSMTFVSDDSGKIVEDKLTQFVLKPADAFIPCIDSAETVRSSSTDTQNEKNEL